MIWCRDFRDRFYTDAAMRDVTRYRGIAFMSGRSVRDRFPADAIIEIRNKRRPTDFFMAGPYPVVSAKLKSILDRFSVEAEYLHIQIVGRHDPPGEWFCFNVTKMANCFDRVNSQYTTEQDFATDIERVAINEAVCGTSPLVLAEKTIPRLLVVRDDVAEAITSAGCTGVVFRRPEDWRNPVNPVV
jgi:hypothetical protein